MRVFCLTCIFILVTRTVWSGPCFYQCSEVPDVVTMSPDGSLTYTVRVCCGGRTVNGSLVEVEIASDVVPLIAWGPDQTPPNFTAFSNQDGEATFNIRGSGCVDFTRFAGITFIVQVRADGIVIAEPSVVTSPDVVNSLGELPTQILQNICENGFTSAGLADAVFHTAPIKQGLVEPCSRFTGDPEDPVSLEDAVVITPYLKLGIGTTCTEDGASGR